MRPINPTIAQLRALISLDETRSFTTTAEKLRLTQPAISHAIRNLEQELGTRLFERHPDGAVPTEAGRIAIAEARAALVHVERLEHAVRGEAMLRTGRLRLACFPSAANWIIPACLAEFHSRYPGVELEIYELADNTCVQAIADRKVDLGMVNYPCEALATYPLFEDQLSLIAPRGKWDGHDWADVAELAGEQFIIPQGACEPLINAAFIAAGITANVTVRSIGQTAGLVVAMIREGIGISIMPACALGAREIEGVNVISLVPPIVRRVAFATSSYDAVPPAARAFLNIVQRRRAEAHELAETAGAEPVGDLQVHNNS